MNTRKQDVSAARTLGASHGSGRSGRSEPVQSPVPPLPIPRNQL